MTTQGETNRKTEVAGVCFIEASSLPYYTHTRKELKHLVEAYGFLCDMSDEECITAVEVKTSASEKRRISIGWGLAHLHAAVTSSDVVTIIVLLKGEYAGIYRFFGADIFELFPEPEKTKKVCQGWTRMTGVTAQFQTAVPVEKMLKIGEYFPLPLLAGEDEVGLPSLGLDV